jgi:hypothetical protein
VKSPAAIRIMALVVVAAGCDASASPSATPIPPATSGPSVLAETPGATDDATPTPAPTAVLLPTAEPTERPAAREWAQDPPRPFLLDAAALVVVDELNVRERPSTSAEPLGTVVRGNVLVFRGPPFEADGYVWYRGWVAWNAIGDVPALPVPILDVGDALSGWFATSRGDVAYVTPIEGRCPDIRELRNVLGMLGTERLQCFGDRSIELEGTFGCAGCTTHIFGEYRPDWLTNPNRTDFLWRDPMEGPALRLRFPPDGQGAPADGTILRVRGHFDDGAAGRCSLALAYPWSDGFTFHAVPDSVARQLCRQEFVVDGYDVLGTDPDFGEAA